MVEPGVGGGGAGRTNARIQRGTQRGKKRRLICLAARTSPIRVLFVPPAIFPSAAHTFPCEAALRFHGAAGEGRRVDADASSEKRGD